MLHVARTRLRYTHLLIFLYYFCLPFSPPFLFCASPAHTHTRARSLFISAIFKSFQLSRTLFFFSFAKSKNTRESQLHLSAAHANNTIQSYLHIFERNKISDSPTCTLQRRRMCVSFRFISLLISNHILYLNSMLLLLNLMPVSLASVWHILVKRPSNWILCVRARVCVCAFRSSRS